ncbi:Protein CBR-SRW-17, partial [Caenorhabditis briggsae]
YNMETDIHKDIYRISQKINIFLQFLTISTNIFHLIVLLQKELRSGAIYILMTGICFCDVINFLLDFYNVGIERVWWSNPFSFIATCLDFKYMYVSPFHYSIQQIIRITRPTATWLAILMALIRTLSVMFPMSNWIQNITKSRNVVFMIFGVFGFWTVFYSWSLVLHRVVWYPDVLNKECFYYNRDKQSYQRYALVMDKTRFTFLFSSESLEPIVRFIPTICYPILTIALIFQLRSIKKKRENVQKNSLSDRSDKTTKLILAMTVCFMLSEGLCGLDGIIIPILNKKIQKKYSEDLADWIKFLLSSQYIIISLRCFNSISHLFVCYSMSSQYRNTFKYVFFLQRKAEIKIIPVKSVN